MFPHCQKYLNPQVRANKLVNKIFFHSCPSRLASVASGIYHFHCRKKDVFQESENDKLHVWKMYKHQHIMFPWVLLLNFVFITYSYWQHGIFVWETSHCDILYLQLQGTVSKNMPKHASISKYQTVDRKASPVT